MQLPDGTDLGEWRLLRERFTEFSRAASGLTAEWVGWPDGGKWTVTGVDDLTIREFQAVCFRGVQLLGGNAGNGSDWVAWLDALRIDHHHVTLFGRHTRILGRKSSGSENMAKRPAGVSRFAVRRGPHVALVRHVCPRADRQKPHAEGFLPPSIQRIESERRLSDPRTSSRASLRR